MGRRKASQLIIRAAERRKKVMRAMLDCTFTTQNELAAQHGVSTKTISKDISICREMIKSDAKDDGLSHLHVCRKRNERNLARAVQAFERSKKNAEEVKTVYNRVPCRECKGTGNEGGDPKAKEWCEACGGEATTVEETVTTRVVGQPGDPRFLKVINECNREYAKLYGLYPEKKKKESKPKHQHVHLHLREQMQRDWEGADPELVLEARKLWLKLERSKNGRADAKAIDVEVVKDDNESEEEE